MDRTLKRDAVLMFASTSILVILTLPACSTEIWSSIGAIIRQGPHHVAQKSTIVRPDECSTSCSKFESVTATALDMCNSPLFIEAGSAADLDCKLTPAR